MASDNTQKPVLGKLEKVNIRKIWGNEAQDFTPWLAKHKNLTMLADAIGGDMEFVLEGIEEKVGDFQADIVCRDVNRDEDSWVVIENQYNKTNHDHLGKLLTYAAGLKAVTILWIAEEIREEHQATLNWLNEITNERYRFFGLEIELWSIGDSENVAPKFNIISKPNNWGRSVARQIRKDDSIRESEIFAQNYWKNLKEYIEAEYHGENKFKLKFQKPPLLINYNFTVGVSGFSIRAKINASKKIIETYLYIEKTRKHLFKELYNDKDNIEKEIDKHLEWKNLPENKTARIFLEADYDPKNQDDWENQFVWFKETLEAFDKTFSPRIDKIKNITADEIIDEQDYDEDEE